MVQPKERPGTDWMKEELADIKARTEKNTLGFRWYVLERTPGYNTGGYYDQDIPEKNEKVSDYFDTEDAAVAWMDEHVADKGKTLHVMRQRLLRREWTEWVNY